MTENKPDAMGTPVYLKCPQCGGDQFTEFAIEETSQGGVRLMNTGDRDYDNASATNIGGDYVKVTGYTCQECDTEYEPPKGTLTNTDEDNLERR